MTSDETAHTSQIVEDLHGYLEGETDLSAAELVQEARGKHTVHESRLCDLIEEWRQKADSAPHDMCAENIYDSAADDLEELIDNAE